MDGGPVLSVCLELNALYSMASINDSLIERWTSEQQREQASGAIHGGSKRSLMIM